MPTATLPFLLVIVLFSLHVDSKSVSDASVFRRVERPGLHIRDPLFNITCQHIRDSLSNESTVYAPGTLEYDKDMERWATSSSQFAACSVEPGNVQDLSIVMKIISGSTTPFAIKGGGHSLNSGFSSTKGVQITMSRFTAIDVHPQSQTVDVGTGLVWDDVYAKLAPMGINVVGGRVSGIGVPGFTLGGGFSWLTNLHGLTVDTVVEFEIVLPSGRIVRADAHNYSDLFWGLKGGLNNFGVVTKITLRTFPQTDVWGGSVVYDNSHGSNLTVLIARWSESNTDPNANILAVYGDQALSILMFYNKPTPPDGLFDDLLAIPALQKDLHTRDFPSFVKDLEGNHPTGLRGAFSCISLQRLTPTILKVIQEQVEHYRTTGFGAGTGFDYTVEPFIHNWTSHATKSAWPHDRFISPTNLYFGWPNSSSDSIIYKAMADTKAVIVKAAEDEGQNLSNIYSYPNYALATDSLESIYGPNVDRLRALAAKYDPGKVMTRTGGFIFQA